MDIFQFLVYMADQEHLALDQLFDKLADELLVAPLETGSKITIGGRLAHIIEAEYRMAKYLFQDDEDLDKLVVNSNSLEDLKNKSIISHQRHILTLNHLKESDLDKIRKSKVSGHETEYKYYLWHFIEHIATHRGQVASAIRRIKN